MPARRPLLLLPLLLPLAACRREISPQDVDVADLLPPLAFTLRDAATGRKVSADDFRGKVILLYFGYTNCPDVCPATLYNVSRILRLLGPLASRVGLLFVTVDPDRDTPATLAQYLSLFGPEFIGLRGDADQLFSLARRYRVVFSVTRPSGGRPYEVTHSAAVYVFDATGQARFLISGLDAMQPDIPGIAGDLADLIAAPRRLSWGERLLNFISAD